MGESRILLVDDDPGIQTLLARYLREQGFAVEVAADARGLDEKLADGLAQSHPVDLIVLDLMLPGEDGLSILRRLDPATRPPVIMLSAQGDEVDRIVGLELGADDYLPKPFNPRELVARIKAVLRRRAADTALGSAVPESGTRIGDFWLDTAQHQAFLRDKPLDLTHGEWQLLAFFLSKPNRVIHRDLIMDALKGYERGAFDRSIDVRVTRLRRKIEDNPAEPRYLITVWGEGYLFVPKGRATPAEAAP
ncbi:response regulator [Halothiobacillus sp. DCM-1]|uniref:response regulator n=1 Tax=Halothiobacillus sp. DCM-1 TaxID=3112558 RepID=UPI0032463084